MNLLSLSCSKFGIVYVSFQMLSKIQLHNKERYFDSYAKSIQYNSVPYGIYAIVVIQQQIYLLSIYRYFPSVKKHVASQCVAGMSDVR